MVKSPLYIGTIAMRPRSYVAKQLECIPSNLEGELKAERENEHVKITNLAVPTD